MLMLVCCAHLACQTKQQTQTIEKLNEKLMKSELTVSQVLTDARWMPLHSMTSFRKIIEKNAKAEKLRITTADEPGLKMTIKCTITDASGKAVPNALVYMYQTSDKGWYSDTAAHISVNSGDSNHARLFGYVRTNEFGEFEMESIRPRGYPRSDLPAHIHIHVWSEDGKAIHRLPDELLFEEDDRLTPARKKEALEYGYLVSKNTGTKEHAVYVYRMAPN